MPPSPANAARHAAALDWLFGRINYERSAALPYSERQLKLDRMRQLLTRLGSPDAGQRVVHIAGTKGKGSTAAMVAAVLVDAGLRVGVYSSPHLERIEERFAVDGRPCTDDELVGLVDRVRPVVEAMDTEAMDTEAIGLEAMGAQAAGGGPPSGLAGVGGPTFFDATTAMALLLFADRRVDVTVLEVGLGGRLDSTNVCHPAVAAITGIGLDHTRQLGDTLELIAAEKAGIIKPGAPVICGETAPGPQGVIAGIARERGCRLHQRGVDFDLEPLPGGPPARRRYWSKEAGGLSPVSLGLDGAHQAANAATALAILDELGRQGLEVADEHRLAGLANTRLAARVEWFPGEPAIVVDAAHNPASAAALSAAVAARPAPGGRTLVLALSRDKDGPAIAAALIGDGTGFRRAIATRYLKNPRAVPPEEVARVLREAASGSGAGSEGGAGGETDPPLAIETAESPAEALRRALDTTPPDGQVVATGSFFLAAEVRPLIVNAGRR